VTPGRTGVVAEGKRPDDAGAPVARPRSGPGRHLRWLIPLAAIPVLALLAYGFRLDPRDVPSPLVGRVAPPFALRSFDGVPLALPPRGETVVVLNFWASWCYPACYQEAPALERGWRTWRDRGVLVIGVDVMDTEEKARKFMTDFGLTFPNAPDEGGRVSIDYGVFGVPETFFIDRAGRIRARHVGAVTDEVFRSTVEPLLAETGQP
jgi:cytochrome c biogenesis protein CcmG/thiol:disulfide interchange protein DsbE